MKSLFPKDCILSVGLRLLGDVIYVPFSDNMTDDPEVAGKKGGSQEACYVRPRSS